MGKSGRIVIAFIVAVSLSGAALRADTGAPGGPSRGTCGFLQGILYKAASATDLVGIFDSIFDCDL